MTNMGSSGECVRSHQEAIGKLASHALRHGAPLRSIIKSLKGIGCPRPKLTDSGGSSCLDLVAKILEGYNKEKVVMKKVGVNKCPECGTELQDGNCSKCNYCGWSSCGG